MYCAINNISRAGIPMAAPSKVIKTILGVQKVNREADCMKAKPCSIQIVLLVSHPKPKVRTSDEVLSALPSWTASEIATCLACGAMRSRFPAREQEEAHGLQAVLLRPAVEVPLDAVGKGLQALRDTRADGRALRGPLG